MRVIAIDPGTTQSAMVLMVGKVLESHCLDDNQEILHRLSGQGSHGWHLAIEMVASYGMPVGREVFETCVWIGRFIQAFGGSYNKVYRREVKSHLCQHSRAKDANVRRSILDMYPPTGGGKTPQVGTKSQPGPLYGVSADIWAAIGVGLTFQQIEP